MKNIYTKTIMVCVIVLASFVFLFSMLELIANAKIHHLFGDFSVELFSSANSGGDSGVAFMLYTASNMFYRSIVIMIFSILALGISITAAVFHSKMDVHGSRIWFYGMASIALIISFVIVTIPLYMGNSFFKSIDAFNTIKVIDSGDSNSIYEHHDSPLVTLKPYLLMKAYIFVPMALISTLSGLLVSAEIIGVLKESISFGSSKTEGQIKSKKVPSAKFEISLDMVTKAKALLDSEVITKEEFKKIKERELNL